MSVMEKQRLSAASFPAMFGVPVDVDAVDAKNTKNRMPVSSKSKSKPSLLKTSSVTEHDTPKDHSNNALLGWLLGDSADAINLEQPKVQKQDTATKASTVKAEAYSKLEAFLSSYQDTNRLDQSVELEAKPVKKAKAKASDIRSIEAFFAEEIERVDAAPVSLKKAPAIVVKQPIEVVTPKKSKRTNVRMAKGAVNVVIDKVESTTAKAITDEPPLSAVAEVVKVDSPEKVKPEPTPAKRLYELKEDEAIAIAMGNPVIKVSANADEIDEANRLEAERIREAIRARKQAKEMALNTTATNSVLYKKPKDIAGSLDIDISSLEEEIKQRLNSGQRRKEEPSYRKSYNSRR